jgi:hypothetical protein
MTITPDRLPTRFTTALVLAALLGEGVISQLNATKLSHLSLQDLLIDWLLNTSVTFCLLVPTMPHAILVFRLLVSGLLALRSLILTEESLKSNQKLY